MTKNKYPKDWEEKKLTELVIKARLGGNYENSESNMGIAVIKMGNIGRGRINLDLIQYLPLTEDYNTEDVLKKGDLLFNTRNTLDLVGKVAIWQNELPMAIYNSNLLKLEFNGKYVSSNYFMNYVFNSYRGIKQLKSFATGTTSVAAIYGRDLMNFKVYLPSIEEQNVIIRILSPLDESITLTENLLSQKLLLKKALMQQLLTGKKRFKEFIKSNKYRKTKYHSYPIDWEYIPVSKVADQIISLNHKNKDLVVLSCTKYKGLVDSLKYFGRKIYSEDTSTYKIVKRNQFAYATNHVEEGSIGLLTAYDEALISPMYTVFETNENVDVNFLYRIFKTETYRHIFEVNTSGSINRRGGLRWADFAKINIPLPSIEEQKAIARFFDDIDNELKLLESKLEQLKLQKKGLMQKLLTGKIRVKVN
jgi:type I restriction enzyme S subunit